MTIQEQEKYPSRVIVYSDTHREADYSDANNKVGQLTYELEQLDEEPFEGEKICVINGDWYEVENLSGTTGEYIDRAKNVEEVIAKAKAHMTKYAEAYPNINFEYIIGNHDCSIEYVSALKEHAEQYKNFHIHDRYFQKGKALFIHGEPELLHPDFKFPPTEKFQRTGLINKINNIFQPIGTRMLARIRHKLPDILDELLEALHVLQKHEKTLQKLTSQDTTPLNIDYVTDIFFGHIHQSFTGLKYKGKTWHNTGATIETNPHLFNPLKFEIDTNDNIKNIKTIIPEQGTNTDFELEFIERLMEKTSKPFTRFFRPTISIEKKHTPSNQQHADEGLPPWAQKLNAERQQTEKQANSAISWQQKGTYLR